MYYAVFATFSVNRIAWKFGYLLVVKLFRFQINIISFLNAHFTALIQVQYSAHEHKMT